MTNVSGGVGTNSHPFRTLKASSITSVVVPAPSTVALMPAPASVLETKLVITDAFGSAIFSFFGVKAATVGQELNCVRMLMRCWALVAFAAWPTQKRLNSMFGLGAEAGMINARVV